MSLRLVMFLACVAIASAARPVPFPKVNITDSSCYDNWSDCKSCVKDLGCAYCTDASDPQYSGYCGPVSVNTAVFKDTTVSGLCNLDNIKYGQCYVSANLVVIIVPSVIGGLVLIIAIAIYCCCRKRAARKHREYMDKAQADEERQAVARSERSDARKSERKAKTDEIRLKYNL
eukprot:Opistho-2@59098